MSQADSSMPWDDKSPAVPDAKIDLAKRLAFLDMSAADAEKLRRLVPAFRATADAFVDAFYKHLTSFPETAQFLQDPKRVERLKQLQKAHFESILEAQWDEQFLEQRLRVGHAHAEVGIEPQLFLGAFSQYLQHSFCHYAKGRSEDVEKFVDETLPLLKAILFDIGLTLDAYFAQLTREMRSALDMFWKANNELRQFAQLTSHDLKTPLATMANLCDEVLDEFADEMPAEAVLLIERVSKRTYRMSKTIDELLSAAITSTSGDPDSQIDSSKVVGEAVDRVRSALDDKQIELVISDDLPMVWADQARLREAFYNLLSNAAKFIDKPQGRIEIGVEMSDQFCTFIIADNGPGIPADELKRIFVPFRRLHRHRDKPGSGLGLYFTKNVIEHQHGRVWAESELGQGSRFFIQLPRLGGSRE
jgi:signal transduction histidine kinase